jgi:hypothetical protein
MAKRAESLLFVPRRHVTRRQHRLGLAGVSIGHRLTGPARRRHELHVDIIDFLIGGDADRPSQAPLVETVAEGGAAAVAGIGQHRAEAQTFTLQAVEFGQRDLALAVRHARPCAPLRIGDPRLGQEQA